MIKKLFKKITPATYDKIESSNKYIFSKTENIYKDLCISLQTLKKEILTKFDNNFSLFNKKLNEIQDKERENIAKDKEILTKFDNNFSLFNKKLNEIQDKEKKILTKFDNNFSLFNKKLNEIQDKERENIAKVKEIQNTLDSIHCKYFYNNNYERKVITSFYAMYEQKDFKEKFLKLIHGLDNQDIERIVLILQRQQLIKDTINKKLDIYSKEEQEQILKIKKELNSQVLRVSDDMYCYKHYFLPINHFEPSVFCYKHGIDCIENLDAIKNKDILDVGGFIGDSILVLKSLTNKRIISFEAVGKNYELLKRTIELNHLENVVPEKIALGSKKCMVDIEIAGSASALTTNGIVKVEGIENIQMDTLDSYISSTDINVGLIKVDIEGAEQDFLKGARKTIEKFKPVLLMSIYHSADDFFNIKPIIESWNLGYKFRIHKPTDYTISLEVLLIAEVR